MGKFFDNFMPLLVRRTFMRISMLTLLLGSFFIPYTAHASSHDQGFPPFPYLVVGTVQVDGSFISESSLLTARIDDWETKPVTVTDGSFGTAPGIPIVIGPPNASYLGKTVTFHLGSDLIAEQSFIFENLPEPAFLQQNLTFISSFDVPLPSDATSVSPSKPSSSVNSENYPNLPSVPDNTRDNTFLWLILLALVAALAVLIYKIRNKKNKA
tara:strand:+ start:22 stop:657 length:636 start_codon:yes stop_codon:yes gene_type:complete